MLELLLILILLAIVFPSLLRFILIASVISVVTFFAIGLQFKWSIAVTKITLPPAGAKIIWITNVLERWSTMIYRDETAPNQLIKTSDKRKSHKMHY